LFFTLLEKEEKRVLTALAGLQAAKNPDPARMGQARQLLETIRKAKMV